MLPRFPAIVISVIVKHSMDVNPVISSINIPNGINVIKATSLVINMLLTKHRNTSVKIIPLSVFTLSKTIFPIY